MIFLARSSCHFTFMHAFITLLTTNKISSLKMQHNPCIIRMWQLGFTRYLTIFILHYVCRYLQTACIHECHHRPREIKLAWLLGEWSVFNPWRSLHCFSTRPCFSGVNLKSQFILVYRDLWSLVDMVYKKRQSRLNVVFLASKKQNKF